MLDYIIVGSGLAGISFCETALKNNKTFIVFNDESQNSSKVAAGLYNPVILKRFSQVWHANEQLNILKDFYTSLEKKLNCKLDYKIPIHRKLFSIEEQNNWYTATDKPKIGNFLSTILVKEKNKYIESPYNFGEVFDTGYVDTNLLITKYIEYLKNQKTYFNETFEHLKLIYKKNYVEYNGVKAKNIIFAEGFGNRYNPFFNYLPVDGTKGELIIIKAINLDLKTIVNSSIYIIPIGNDTYKVGATYNWEDKTNIPTENGKIELLENLKKIISCNFEVIEHIAGVRPTVKDRRPLVGTHPSFKKYHIINGLGTRGVMLAPELVSMLYEHIENKSPIDDYIDIKRYQKLISSFY